jgi:sarcosine oxidase subunit gamma
MSAAASPHPATVQPAGLPRRSFVARKLAAAGARFGDCNGSAVALDFGDPAGEAAAARRLGLADLSPLPRAGFKGLGTADWLAGQGIVVPADSNRAARQANGPLAARLAPGELLILGGLDGAAAPVARLEAAWRAEPVPPQAPRGFPVPRADSHAWFLLSGACAPAAFAKLCGVDLRAQRFADLAIAQTQIARLSGIIVRDDLRGPDGAILTYHLLADSASAEYLWDCLLDAMVEFQGRPVGLTALRQLGNSQI